MLAHVPFAPRIANHGPASRGPLGGAQPMVRRWRGRLECVFQAQAEADPWSEHLAARAAEARLRHRGVLDELKSLIGAGALDFAEAAGRLTAEGDCNLQAMLSIAHDHMTQEYGTAPGRYAVFALGKFGGAEMTLGSDLDLLFVYEPLNEEAAVLAADYFGRLAQRLTQLLVTAPDWRVAYEVDFRLRPHGADGPLATSLSGLRHYLQTEAWPWEMQALTRLRPVAGCERLSAEVAALAVQSIALRCAALDPKAEVSEMRALLQAEKPASHDWDLKQRPGGMVDIEFIAQALQLVSAQGRVPVIAANTGEALTRLADAGHLSKADSKHLLAAWRLLSALRQLQAVFNVTDLSQLKGPEKAALRRMLDITPAALTNRLNSACARTRALFEDLVGALDQPVDQQAVA